MGARSEEDHRAVLMARRRFGLLSLRCRVMLIVFAGVALSAELMVHRTFAREYYELDVKNLQLMALMAVNRGAQYLPEDPRAGVRLVIAFPPGKGQASH